MVNAVYSAEMNAGVGVAQLVGFVLGVSGALVWSASVKKASLIAASAPAHTPAAVELPGRYLVPEAIPATHVQLLSQPGPVVHGTVVQAEPVKATYVAEGV